MSHRTVEHPHDLDLDLDLDLDQLYSPPVVVAPLVAVDLAALVLAGGVR
ncbi:hypothetical protein [Pseudonocardia sp. ICBG601]|nr:hypothetical protein [Pseudonocardia sp. ICBG601]